MTYNTERTKLRYVNDANVVERSESEVYDEKRARNERERRVLTSRQDA